MKIYVVLVCAGLLVVLLQPQYGAKKKVFTKPNADSATATHNRFEIRNASQESRAKSPSRFHRESEGKSPSTGHRLFTSLFTSGIFFRLVKKSKVFRSLSSKGEGYHHQRLSEEHSFIQRFSPPPTFPTNKTPSPPPVRQ